MKSFIRNLVIPALCAAFVASFSACSRPAAVSASTGTPEASAASAAVKLPTIATATQSVASQTVQPGVEAPDTSTPAPPQEPATPAPAPTPSPAPAWPNDAPKAVPRFQYGKCVACDRFLDDLGMAAVHLDYQGVKASDLDKYAKALESGGYVVSRESSRDDMALSGVLMDGGEVVAFVMIELHPGTGLCSCELTYRTE